MSEIPHKYFESNFTDGVVDTVRPTDRICDLIYTNESGIGIVTPDGERVHIEWSVAKTRFIPVNRSQSDL